MIRPATIYDILEIEKMWQNMMIESGISKDNNLDGERFILETINNMRKPNYRYFICEEGYISGYVDQFDCINKLSGFYEHLYVYPEYRKKGIAEELTNKLQEFFKECNVTEERYIGKHQKQGFKIEMSVFVKEV